MDVEGICIVAQTVGFYRHSNTHGRIRGKCLDLNDRNDKKNYRNDKMIAHNKYLSQTTLENIAGFT